mmetsp:Transcript_19813/g.36895  ORF Transcript_19813/g.36895 Transcript_19813/m.36895 type:complete len:184 (+) Transcript_19813:200-751(+)
MSDDQGDMAQHRMLHESLPTPPLHHHSSSSTATATATTTPGVLSSLPLSLPRLSPLTITNMNLPLHQLPHPAASDNYTNSPHYTNPTASNLFTCTQCSRRLPSSHLLTLHINELHNPFHAPSFRCLVPSCPETFPYNFNRTQHLVQVHGFNAGFKFHSRKWEEKERRQYRLNVRKSKKSTQPP